MDQVYFVGKPDADGRRSVFYRYGNFCYADTLRVDNCTDMRKLPLVLQFLQSVQVRGPEEAWTCVAGGNGCGLLCVCLVALFSLTSLGVAVMELGRNVVVDTYFLRTPPTPHIQPACLLSTPLLSLVPQ